MRISADTMSDFREYLDKIGIDVNTRIIMSNIDLFILYAYQLTNQYFPQTSDRKWISAWLFSHPRSGQWTYRQVLVATSQLKSQRPARHFRNFTLNVIAVEDWRGSRIWYEREEGAWKCVGKRLSNRWVKEKKWRFDPYIHLIIRELLIFVLRLNTRSMKSMYRLIKWSYC